MAFKYIQYVYPVPYNFEKFLIWASGNFNCYFAIKEKQDDSWMYYAGNGSHALATGKLLTSYGSSQTNAETNYLTTSKDSNNKIIAVLPSLSFARFIRLYIDDASSEYIYEFRPSTRLLADEIIAGNLEITDDFLVPPLITVKSSNVDRIKIGNFSDNTFGIVGYDASSNLIFEISDNQQVIGGFTLGSGGFSGGSDIKIDSANKKISINSDTFGNSGIQLDYNSGSPRAYIGDGSNQYFEFDGTDVFWKGNNAELTKAGELAVSNINATGGSVGGWSLSQYKLTCDSGAVGLNSEATGGTNWRIWVGDSTPSIAPFRVDENGNFYATSATINGSITATTGIIGGWIVGTSKLQSDSSNEMIVLDQGKLRISIFDAVNEKVVMGYLNDLPRNNGSGTSTSATSTTLTDSSKDWQTNEHSNLEVVITGGDGSGQTRTISSNTSDTLTVSSAWTINPSSSTYEIRYAASDYGFWARSGDELRIDGDVTYESGDWIVQHDGSYLIQDSVGHNIIRLGTDTGEKGLFIYDTDGTQLAKLISDKIYIGTVGDYLQYDTANGMQIAGTITVSSGSSGISNFSDAGPLVDADNLDEVPDGTSYARVLASSLSSGLVLLSQASGSLDNISDGSTYGRVNLTSISAGNILLSAAIGSLDDISDGTSYGRILATDISAGHILLSEATGDLDDISDGASYGRVATTSISAGKIILTGGAGVDGTLSTDYTEADVTPGLPSDDNLAGYWSFDEGTGSSLKDSSTNENDGVIYGSPSWVAGKSGYALDFGATASDYVEISSPSGLSSSEVSVSAWVYINAMESYHGFVRHNWANPGSWFLYTSSTQIAFGVYDTDRRRVAYTCDISGEWHHLVGTFDGTTMKLYLDGSEVGTPSAASVSLDTTSPIKLSSDSYAKKIDEVRIYNRALSQDEIKALYLNPGGQKAPIPGADVTPGLPSDDNLAGYWSLDEGSGSSLKDSSTNENDGTIYGSPSWVAGKSGYALDFDGVDDYVSVPDDDSLDFDYDEDFTVCGWIKLPSAGQNDLDHTANYLFGKQGSVYAYSLFFYNSTYSSPGTIRFHRHDGTNTVNATIASTTFNDDTWHFICVKKDGGTIYFYVDGEQQGSVADTMTSSTLNNEPFQIGLYADRYLTGCVDEVRIYDRALSESEIKALYLNPGGQKAPIPGADVTSDQFTNSLSTIDAQTDKVELGLDANGALITKVIPASAVAPTGAGLYLGSDYLGYYDSSSWVTYMDNSGNFYLGGSNGPLQWNSSSSTLSIGISALPNLPSDENLVGYWSLNDGSDSTIVIDNSRNGNDGIIYGSPSWVAGKSGYALDFDGVSNQYIGIDSPNNILPGPNSMSVCGWVKGTWSGSNYDRFFNAYVINSQAGTQFFAGADNGTGKLRVRFSDGTNYAVTTFTDATWLDNSWHHVAVVYDRDAGKAYVYIDAVKSSTELDISAITGSIDTVTTFRFGVDGAANNDLNGALDELRVYNKALSESEIKALFLNPGGTKSQMIAGGQINVPKLSAISANLGEITAGSVTGIDFYTAASGKRVHINNEGIQFETGAFGAPYGDSNYKYGDSDRKYGTGVAIYFWHDDHEVPIYISEERNVADIHLYDRANIPTGPAEAGDVCCVSKKLMICTASGNPGVWSTVFNLGESLYANKLGIGESPTDDTEGVIINPGLVTLKEISSTPANDSGYGKLYTKTNEKLYFQDGGGTEHELTGTNLKLLSLDYGGSLATMVSNVGSDEMTVFIDTSDTLLANLNIPANINLKWLKGCSVSLNGYTLTISRRCIEAGVYELFKGSGTVTIGA